MVQPSLFRSAGLIALGLMAASVMQTAPAVPANPTPLWLQQPDGSRFKARRWGDERQHGLETDSGFTILQDPATQVWTYARQRCDGQLVPSTDPVTTDETAVPAPPLKPHLRPSSASPVPCKPPTSDRPGP